MKHIPIIFNTIRNYLQLIAIPQRYKNFGFETYLLPQDERLPLSNRREDILIIKP
jgi:hypothetical protein